MHEFELPLGFGMALAQNEAAMSVFETLSEDEKKAIINKTRDVKSKSEMKSLVNSLLGGVD